MKLGECMSQLQRIQSIITDTIAQYIADVKPATRWGGSPIINSASADDPLFEELRNIVGPTHATPREVLPSARTVVSYFIPFHKDILRGFATATSTKREH